MNSHGILRRTGGTLRQRKTLFAPSKRSGNSIAASKIPSNNAQAIPLSNLRRLPGIGRDRGEPVSEGASHE